MKVYQAINAVQADLAKQGVSKNQTNTFDGYKFRGIDDVYNALSPLLAKHQLCILPRILTRAVQERTSKKGDALFYVTIEAEFDFISSEDGSKHTVRVYGEAMDRGDKATNKAMATAYKYAAFLSFAIPTESEKADTENESHEVKGKDTITPTTGVLASLPAKKQKVVMDTAVLITDAMAEDRVTDAFGLYDASGFDQDERVAVWSLLSSQTRAILKRLHDAQNKKPAVGMRNDDLGMQA